MKNLLITLILAFLGCQALLSQELKPKIFSDASIHLRNTLSVKNLPKYKKVNFNAILDFSQSDFEFQNRLSDQSSLFVALLSSDSKQKEFLTLKSSRDQILLSNTALKNKSETVLDQVEPKDGMLVNYQFHLKAKKRNLFSIQKETFEGASAKKNKLLEVIYFPGFISDKKSNQIESYLSIKYGISLLPKSDYYSTIDTLWSPKKAKGFESRVTGIGRSDYFGLYQPKSKNSKNDGLTVGIKVSKINSEKLFDDKSFILWSDNDKDPTFIFDKHKGHDVINRNWRVESTRLNTSKATTVTVDPIQLFKSIPEKDEIVWLVQSTDPSFKKNIQKVKGIYKNDILKFKKVNIPKTAAHKISYFTFIKTSDFFVEESLVYTDCKTDKGSASFKILSGKAPFSIRTIAQNGKSNQREFKTTEYTLELPRGDYSIVLTDATGKEYATTFTFDQTTFKGSLSSLWQLSEYNQVLVSPTLEENIEGSFSYSYTKNQVEVCSTKLYKATQEGDYKLTVINNKGCKEIFSFTVSKQKTNSWSLYPNPVAFGEDFTVALSYKKPQDVTISVQNLNGQIVSKKKFSNITKYTYNYTTDRLGVYIIRVASSAGISTRKLIVY